MSGIPNSPDRSQDPGQGPDGEPIEGTVDPELIPYLEAAAEPDGEDVDTSADPRVVRERELAALDEREEQDAEALRLLASGGLLGDVAALEEVDGFGGREHRGDGEGLGGEESDAWDEELRHLDELRAVAAEGEIDARLAEIYADIVARAPEHDIDPTLDRVREVLALLGNPHQAAPVVHITGTNGKTSTARMIEALLRGHNLRTGRFTSPHLHSVRERIAIDGEPLAAEAFVRAWEDVEPYVAMVDERSAATGGARLSFFEVLSVLAFAAFADAPVDVIVLEVGLGGRWDATNVADGTVAVLTPIARDHERWLGHELTAIAGEKVGIIKDGATVVTAAQVPEVAALVASAAAEQRAHLVVEGPSGDPGTVPTEGPEAGDAQVLGTQFVVGGQLVTLRTPAAVYEDVIVPLHGEHQAHNALLAVTAVEAFFGGGALDGTVVEEAMTSVTSPGRLEVLRTSPLVVLDAAHNPAGAAATRTAMEATFGLRHLVGVLGIMDDKDAEGVLAELEPLLEEIVVTPVPSERAMDVDELAELARDVFGEERVRVAEDLTDAIDTAVTLAEADGGAAMTHEAPSGQVIASSGVLVLGSIVLVAQARALLGKSSA